MSNTQNTKNKRTSSSAASSKSQNLDQISASELPHEILKVIACALKKAHWVAIAPDTTSAMITERSVAEFPPGYTIVMIFDEQQNTPARHKDGTIYILSE